MKFGEQFPSLKGKDKITTKTFDVIFNDYWKQTDIQKHCLDKQKVKDKIKEFKEGIDSKQACADGCCNSVDLDGLMAQIAFLEQELKL